MFLVANDGFRFEVVSIVVAISVLSVQCFTLTVQYVLFQQEKKKTLRAATPQCDGSALSKAQVAIQPGK